MHFMPTPIAMYTHSLTSVIRRSESFQIWQWKSHEEETIWQKTDHSLKISVFWCGQFNVKTVYCQY